MLSLIAKKTIDATGLFCPGPIQIVKGVARKVERGTVLELLADDPDTTKDVEEWCEETGNTLLSTEEKDGTLIFSIKINYTSSH